MALPRLRSAAYLAAVAAGLLALGACGSKAPDNITASPTGQGQLGDAPSASATATPSTNGSTPAPTSGQTTNPPTQTTSQPPSGPHIVYFRVKTQPSCPSSGPATYYPGNPVTLEWQVAGGATGVEVSIDGPGMFGSYGTQDAQDFPFSCSGQSNTMQTHTYTLTTVGGGQARSQTLTVQARIN